MHLRRGRQNREHEQSPSARIPDAVRYTFWCHHQLPCSHGELATLEQEQSVAFEHEIQLVHPLMGMEFVQLTWLESVEPDE